LPTGKEDSDNKENTISALDKKFYQNEMTVFMRSFENSHFSCYY